MRPGKAIFRYVVVGVVAMVGALCLLWAMTLSPGVGSSDTSTSTTESCYQRFHEQFPKLSISHCGVNGGGYFSSNG